MFRASTVSDEMKTKSIELLKRIFKHYGLGKSSIPKSSYSEIEIRKMVIEGFKLGQTSAILQEKEFNQLIGRNIKS